MRGFTWILFSLFLLLCAVISKADEAEELPGTGMEIQQVYICLLYTSDAADD